MTELENLYWSMIRNKAFLRKMSIDQIMAVLSDPKMTLGKVMVLRNLIWSEAEEDIVCNPKLHRWMLDNSSWDDLGDDFWSRVDFKTVEEAVSDSNNKLWDQLIIVSYYLKRVNPHSKYIKSVVAVFLSKGRGADNMLAWLIDNFSSEELADKMPISIDEFRDLLEEHMNVDKNIHMSLVKNFLGV